CGHINEEIPQEFAFIGALSLDGTIVKIQGMLPALIAAKELGFKGVLLPYDPLIPFDMVEGLDCHIVHHIQDVIQFLKGQVSLPENHPKENHRNPLLSLHIKRIFHISLGMNKRNTHWK